MSDFYNYKLKLGRETKVVDLKTGNILELSANSYDLDGSCSANFLDVDGYYTSIDVNEENYKDFPFVSDYIRLPENRAVFSIMFQEFERLRNNLRNV